jgi:hypothetical protein
MGPADSAVVLVKERNRSEIVSDLGMRCDEREIPYPIDEEDIVGHWITMAADFHGAAVPHGSSQNPVVKVYRAQPMALAVTRDRLYGICAPEPANTEPAIWVSVPLECVAAGAEGKQGLFRKRPRLVKVTGDGWEFQLYRVNRMYLDWGRWQPWQEESLLMALSRASA